MDSGSRSRKWPTPQRSWASSKSRVPETEPLARPRRRRGRHGDLVPVRAPRRTAGARTEFRSAARHAHRRRALRRRRTLRHRLGALGILPGARHHGARTVVARCVRLRRGIRSRFVPIPNRPPFARASRLAGTLKKERATCPPFFDDRSISLSLSLVVVLVLCSLNRNAASGCLPNRHPRGRSQTTLRKRQRVAIYMRNKIESREIFARPQRLG